MVKLVCITKNYVINPCICDNYYKLFEGEDFKYLGTADEVVGKDLPKCTVGIYVGPKEVRLIVRKGGEELLNRTAKREDKNA